MQRFRVQFRALEGPAAQNPCGGQHFDGFLWKFALKKTLIFHVFLSAFENCREIKEDSVTGMRFCVGDQWETAVNAEMREI